MEALARNAHRVQQEHDKFDSWTMIMSTPATWYNCMLMLGPGAEVSVYKLTRVYTLHMHRSELPVCN